MDHRSWLASRPESERLKLAERSNIAGLIHLIGHVALIAICSILIIQGVSGWWLLLPVQGVLLVFLFTLEHEATHQTPFRSTWVNEVAGHLAGLVIILPFLWFRYFHLAHHRWTNVPGKDPELDEPKPANLRPWLWHVSGLPYWIGVVKLMVRLVRGVSNEEFMPKTARGRVVNEARLLALIYLALACSLIWSPLLLWVWIIPVLLGQPFLRLYLLAEHGDCPFVANMFENTRTIFTTSVVRFLAWNMPYHVEHHVSPSVPFHHLPTLHQAMRDQLKVTANGYAAFTRAYLERRTGHRRTGRAAADDDAPTAPSRGGGRWRRR